MGLSSLSEAAVVDYDPPLRFLSRVFLRDAGGTPGAAAIGAVRSALEVEEDLQLGVLQQIAIETGQIRNGIGLFSKNGVWAVSLTSESIDITYNAMIASPKVPFASFVQRSKAAFVALMAPSGMKGNRIACVSEGLLPEMSATDLDDLAKRLLRFPKAFSPAPWEWDWRCVSSVVRTFGDRSENTNTLAAAKRIVGQFPTGEAFDRVRLDLDINTHAADTSARFAHQDVAAFFDSYPAWYGELKTEIEAFVSKDVP